MQIAAQNQIDEILEISRKRREEILNSPSVYPKDRTTYYIDSKKGNDENDGFSPHTAWKSLSHLDNADLNEGDVVLFRRGCEFRGTMSSQPGVTYSAYGEGKKPELLCSINASDPDLWVPTKWENVWMYKNIISYVRDIGAVFMNDGEYWGIKVYKNFKTNERCDMYRQNGRRGEGVPHGHFDVWNGRTMVHRECTVWNGPQDLKGDLEFYHNWNDERLYIYCPDGNPGRVFKRVELSVRYFNFKNGSNDNVTVDNLSFKYAGIHAITSGSCKNLTVRNCEFAFIGGSGMFVESLFRREENIPLGSDMTRLGNAIEIYGTCDGYLVENNYIRQIYDTGITVQMDIGKPNEDKIIKNVCWRDNLIDGCHWSLELWLSSSEDLNGHTVAYRNIDISNNICLNDGFGWGNQRPDVGGSFFYGGYIYSNYADFENYAIHDNVFFNSDYAVFSSNGFGKDGIKFENNKIYNGSKLCSCGTDFTFRSLTSELREYTDENIEKAIESGYIGANDFYILDENNSGRYIKFK